MNERTSDRKRRVSALFAAASALLIMVTGCPPIPDTGGNDNTTANDNTATNDNTSTNDNTGGTDKATYVGSDTCLGCHGAAAVTGSDHSNFWNTGHPYKLNKVENGVAPTYPFTTLADPPPGIEWSDVAFVIGGFRYKWRVVDNDGFVVLGPTAQYNYPTQGRSAYSNDDKHTTPDGTPGPWEENIGRKPYNCGKCHTTGYDADAENHLGLEGLVGDWQFEGIHCEECHGAGSLHVAASTSEDRQATIDGSPDTDTVCGKCHTRNADGIEASGGFIRHHEQWDEYSRTVHATVMAADGCMTCHDTHEPLFDTDRLAAIQAAADAGSTEPLANLGSPPGIIKECTECHTTKTVTHMGPTDCKVCHMAYTDKSAVAINANAGDIRGHIWAINTDATAQMFTDVDGNPVDRDSSDLKFAALDDNGHAFITLDFACLQCHTDEDVNWAADNAGSIHDQ